MESVYESMTDDQRASLTRDRDLPESAIQRMDVTQPSLPVRYTDKFHRGRQEFKAMTSAADATGSTRPHQRPDPHRNRSPSWCAWILFGISFLLVIGFTSCMNFGGYRYVYRQHRWLIPDWMAAHWAENRSAWNGGSILFGVLGLAWGFAWPFGTGRFRALSPPSARNTFRTCVKDVDMDLTDAASSDALESARRPSFGIDSSDDSLDALAPASCPLADHDGTSCTDDVLDGLTVPSEATEELRRQLCDLTGLVARQEASIKTLVNQLFMARGRFWVVLRLHIPDSVGDRDGANVRAVPERPSAVVLVDPEAGGPDTVKTLADFDYVLPAGSTNHEVWGVVQPVVQRVLQPDNRSTSVIVVDGQSGGGKSHTMFDHRDSVAGCAAAEVFARAGSGPSGRQLDMQCGFIEVYLGQAYDQLKEGESKAISSLEGLGYHACATADAFLGLLENARCSSHHSRTRKNANSSRGHFVVSIRVRWRSPSGVNVSGGASPVDKTTWSSLLLVDLAGSERATAGDRMAQRQEQERRAINDERTDFHTWLEKNKAGERFHPSKNLGKLLLPALTRTRKIVYIACIRLADAADSETQKLAKQDVTFAHKLARVKTKAPK